MKPAALIVVTTPKRDRILLTKRKDVPVWVLPGGGREDGEEPDVAARRELEEETGITNCSLLHVLELLQVHRCSAPTSLFFTELPEERLQDHLFFDRTNESTDIRMFSLSSLPCMLFPLHKIWLEEVFARVNNGRYQLPIVRAMNEAHYSSLTKIALSHPWCTLRYLITRLLLKLL